MKLMQQIEEIIRAWCSIQTNLQEFILIKLLWTTIIQKTIKFTSEIVQEIQKNLWTHKGHKVILNNSCRIASFWKKIDKRLNIYMRKSFSKMPLLTNMEIIHILRFKSKGIILKVQTDYQWVSKNLKYIIIIQIQRWNRNLKTQSRQLII